MEENCEKVLAAAEKVRRRASKWDVPEEHHVETEIKIDYVLPAKVDDTFMDHTELDSPRPSLSMDVDKSEIDKSTNQSEMVAGNTIIQSDAICEMPPNPEQFGLEGECKDGFVKHDWDHVSKKHMHDHVENQDKQHKGTNEMSPGQNERRQQTRSRSPIDSRSRLDRKRNRSRTRSRSPTNDSRSKSWSRSRSPSHVYRQGSERWTDTGRTRGMMPICRDFTSGRCRRDDCRFLHEGGGLRQIGRQHDVGSTDGRGSRSDNVNYSREKHSRRHDDPYEDGRGSNESHRGNDNNESHRGYRVPNRCFDFTKGRCQRGASCRYSHHGASSDGVWNARDESRVRSHDRSGSRSENIIQEWKPVYKVPCRFFLENNCRNGERCKFSHQVKPADNPVASSVDSELRDQTAHFAPPLHFNGQIQQIMHSHPQNTHNQFPVLLPMPNSPYFNTSLLNQPSQPLRYELNLQNPDSQVQVQQNLLMQSQSESSYKRNQQNVPPIHIVQNQNAGAPIQQNVPPIHNAQNQPDFNSAVPIQQTFPPNHNAQNQPEINFGIPIQQNVHPIHKVQNPTDFNLGISIQQNVPPIPQNVPPMQQNVPLIQQNVPLIQQNVPTIQQNVPPIHRAQNQTDFNLGIPIQLNVPPIHSTQNQPNFNLGVPIQQNVPAIHNVQNQTDFNPRVPVQHNVHPTHNVQNQSDFKVGVLSQQNLASDGQRHQIATSPSHISDAKKLMEKNQTSVQQHMALQCADSLDPKPPQTNSDIPITNKVVTSEQAAKIIDLSASLAQFFGTAALNSQATAGMTPQPFLNPGSLNAFATTAAPLPTEVVSSQTNLSRPIPLAEKPRIQQVVSSNEREVEKPIPLAEKPHIQQAVSSNEREVEKPEAPQVNKDQIEQLPSDDEESKKNGDNKKSKEGKDVRMFKCALIEFVKEMLKPKWKEGQLSKEAHKTIVKKVVDKVCGSLQGLNVLVPQTQEKIDIYLLSSKPKLSKLVQAYVEKYVKS